MYRMFFVLVVIATCLAACTQEPKSLTDGVWRGVLLTDSAVEIPFNFEIYDSLGSKQLAFINGDERLNINEVSVEGDSVFIKTPLYESEIKAAFTSEGLSGRWLKHLPDRTIEMPFSAKPNVTYRFTEDPKKALYDVSGRWSVQFLRNGGKDTALAVGEFTQKGNIVNGSFLTPTGDYRYLNGVVDGNMLFLSGFSGSGASLFTAELASDSVNLINGRSFSGPSGVTSWLAGRDNDAALPDAYKITYLTEGTDKIDFTFKDLEGNDVSLSDNQFKNKVVVVQFMGSWCPNCMDETAFLAPFYDKYKSKGLEIIGLAYERYKEPERAKAAVLNLKKRFHVNYPLLLTGYTNDKKLVEESIKGLENFASFPTTILIDKTGKVRKIHSGFSGPATGHFYHEFVEEFTSEVEGLLNE
ncbi:peroxiredoxin family protein [Olivibacter sitiensis]|uniref:peroxiredoxin family protein n=1 Tax=Olivibacter sitiensis TaxID=376470 RepID=UPI000482D44B|nr:TlpA disulfide reductase family protein [Olivibacter sitiensis]